MERGVLYQLLCIVIQSICITARSDTLIQNVTRQLCPYTDFCQQNASKTLTNLNFDPCCSKCSCEDDCWEIDNCCPDMVNRPTKVSELVCRRAIVKKPSSTTDGGFFNNYNGIQYLVTDRCPNTSTPSELREGCEKASETTLTDFVWVSDAVSGNIFQNEYCALCNGVSAWEKWNLVTNCEQVLNATFENLSAVLLSDACAIMNDAEGELFAKTYKFRCYIPDISVCNITGKWDAYDKEIEEACHTTNVLPFFVSMMFGHNIYKNVFCYLCNTPQRHVSNTKCNKRNDDNMRSRQPVLSLMINYDGKENNKVHSFECARNEIHDKYTKQCRKLHCPFGSAPAYGECKKLLVGTRGLDVILCLNLETDWNVSTLQSGQLSSFAPRDWKKLYNAMTKKIGLQKCTIHLGEILSPTRATVNAETNLTIQLLFYIKTNFDCQFDTIYDNKAEIDGKKVVTAFNKNQRMVASIRGTCPLSNDTDRAIPLFVEAKPGRFTGHVRIFNLQKLCPEIELQYSEVTSRTSKDVRDQLVKLFDNSKNLSDPTTALVCVADYFKLMEMASSISTRIRSINISLVALLIAMISDFVFTCA